MRASLFGTLAGGGAAIDPDAQAFITAAGITDPTQQTAINDLVVGLKADSLWTKMVALYPFVGGTDASHKWNLKDPRDLDAAFRLTFVGGLTSSTQGVLADGSTGYANTHLNPNAILTPDNFHISLYTRTYNYAANTEMYAAFTGSAGAIRFNQRNPSDVTLAVMGSVMFGSVSGSNTQSQGFFLTSRTPDPLIRLCRNNIQLGTLVPISTPTLTTLELPLFATNFGGSIMSFHPGQLCCFTIGSGLSNAESTILYNLINAMQISLGRDID